MRKVIQLGRGSKKLYAAIRSSVPYLSHDRIIAEDIKKAVQVIKKVLEEKA